MYICLFFVLVTSWHPFPGEVHSDSAVWCLEEEEKKKNCLAIPFLFLIPGEKG